MVPGLPVTAIQAPLKPKRVEKESPVLGIGGSCTACARVPKERAGPDPPPVLTEAGLAKEKVKLEIGLQLPERDRKGTIYLSKEYVYQEDISYRNIYAPNTRAGYIV